MLLHLFDTFNIHCFCSILLLNDVTLKQPVSDDVVSDDDDEDDDD